MTTSSSDSDSSFLNRGSEESSSDSSEKCLDLLTLQRKEKRDAIVKSVQVKSHFFKMVATKYHKEICAVIFVIASGLAALRGSPPKTLAPPTPSPFFAQNTIQNFHDNFRGEYFDLATQVIPFHPTFIFYYAPWDSECVALRVEFLKLADHFNKIHPNLVKFYAVNCWWMDGECRQHYKNLSHYPILVAHVASYLGIIYNGPLRFELMTRFISNAIKPFTRMDTEEEVWRFRAQHDTTILAFFNFSDPNSNRAFETYRQMALRNLEADPFGQVGFALVLKPQLAAKYFLTTSNAISLLLFNEMHTAKWVGSYHEKGLKGPVSQVSEWIQDRTKTLPLTWLYPLRNGFSNRPISLAPTDLSQELWKGPIFLLVTKRYFPYTPFYMQLKEVVLDYFNCNRSGNVTKLRRTSHAVNGELLALWTRVHSVCKSQMTPKCKILWDQLEEWNDKKSEFKKESLKNYESLSQSLNFTGLSCEVERPFRFYAVDPTDIQLVLNGKDPMGFIIDAENELLIPFHTFNISSIALAISEFSTQTKFNNKLWSDQPTTSNSSIKKFNSEELMKFLNNRPLLLMYTAKFCGYCGVALSHFVRLENFLKNYNLNLTLGKIDVFKNSLPPGLSPTDIPSFVYFSAGRNASSFPNDESMTTQNLLKFLLSELDSDSRVSLSMQTRICQNSENCVSQNKERVTEQIHSILQSLKFDWTELLDHLRAVRISLDLV